MEMERSLRPHGDIQGRGSISNKKVDVTQGTTPRVDLLPLHPCVCVYTRSRSRKHTHIHCCICIFLIHSPLHSHQASATHRPLSGAQHESPLSVEHQCTWVGTTSHVFPLSPLQCNLSSPCALVTGEGPQWLGPASSGIITAAVGFGTLTGS